MQTACYWVVDNNRFRPSPTATERYQPSYSKVGCYKGRRKEKEKRENLVQRHPLTASRRLGFFVAFFTEGRRRLRPKNLRTMSRMRKTSRDYDFFATVFSSSPSPRLRQLGKEEALAMLPRLLLIRIGRRKRGNCIMNKPRNKQYPLRTNDMPCLKDFLAKLEASQAQQPLVPDTSIIQ
ncbi:hypothetical protein B296_00055077 [Ensete ventricosum]|uniref:Uncharacterized protein n=1 Tax=Ensete ventricosum TaxID=4639 RepID=A0A426Y1V4_ENSVE|nr:hypothetical protein B296_00055077 [Ensete ventricosum]